MSSGMISVSSGMLPAMKITDPYSPMARAKARVKPVSNAGSSGGRMTRARMWKRLAPRSAAASSCSALAIPQHRLDGPHDERQADEHERHQDAERREGDAEIRGAARGRPIQPVRRVKRGQGDAGDRGRQPERQVDERIDETPPGKPVAHQHPGDEDSRRRR